MWTGKYHKPFGYLKIPAGYRSARVECQINKKKHFIYNLAKFEMSEEVTTDAVAPPAEQASKLTNAQKARIERNLAKAQRLREAKLVLHPFKDLAR